MKIVCKRKNSVQVLLHTIFFAEMLRTLIKCTLVKKRRRGKVGMPIAIYQGEAEKKEGVVR